MHNQSNNPLNAAKTNIEMSRMSSVSEFRETESGFRNEVIMDIECI